MRIFSPDGENIVLEADDLLDAIELQSLSTFSFAEKVGIRLEVNRNQHFRAIIPTKPRIHWPEFDRWFKIWAPNNKDPEIKRVCDISWRAALSYANAPDEEIRISICGSSKDKFVCNLPMGHVGDHQQVSDGGGVIGWPR